MMGSGFCCPSYSRKEEESVSKINIRAGSQMALGGREVRRRRRRRRQQQRGTGVEQ